MRHYGNDFMGKLTFKLCYAFSNNRNVPESKSRHDAEEIPLYTHSVCKPILSKNPITSELVFMGKNEQISSEYLEFLLH